MSGVGLIRTLATDAVLRFGVGSAFGLVVLLMVVVLLVGMMLCQRLRWLQVR